MTDDPTPELTATRKPRTTGKLLWFAIEHAGLQLLEDQPEHADIAAASKWLADEVAAERLPPAPATYALHRAICTVSPRVEVTRKAVLL